jgi:hypothetical protein
MMTNSRRTLLTALLLGVLVIGASVMHSSEEKPPGAQTVAERDGRSTSDNLGSGPDEIRRPAVASVGNNSDDIFHILQEIRDSLKREDLASANVSSGAVQTLRKDNSRALTRQKELQARKEDADAVTPIVPPENPPSSAKPTRSTARLPARAERSSERPSPVRDHTFSTSHHSRHMDAPKIEARSNSSVNVVNAGAASPVLRAERRDSNSLQGVPNSASTIAVSPPGPAPVRPMLPVEDAQRPAQPAAPRLPQLQASQAPKTRAQVRAELDRARADGSLPRFGNPDPAGPGGVPSSTKTEFGNE